MNVKQRERWWRVLVAIIFVAALAACEDPPQTIVPDGTYETSSKEEAVTIEGGKITFRVFVDDARTQLSNRSSEFDVWPEGKIVPHPLASQEMLTGIGKFEWRWDGSAIVQSDPRRPDRPATIFRREGQTTGADSQ
jgi:hypothetical protein